MGMQWTGALLAGLEGIPKFAIMSWWTTKGASATKLREEEERLLRICVRKWGLLLTYVFDRGYAFWSMAGSRGDSSRHLCDQVDHKAHLFRSGRE